MFSEKKEMPDFYSTYVSLEFELFIASKVFSLHFDHVQYVQVSISNKLTYQTNILSSIIFVLKTSFVYAFIYIYFYNEK